MGKSKCEISRRREPSVILLLHFSSSLHFPFCAHTCSCRNTYIHCISKSQVRRTGWSSYVSAERIPWCESMLLNMKPSSISVTTKANAIVPLHGPRWNLSKVAKVAVVVAEQQRLTWRETMVVARCTRSAAPVAALDYHRIRRQPGSQTSRRRSFRAVCQGGLRTRCRASHRERISS